MNLAGPIGTIVRFVCGANMGLMRPMGVMTRRTGEFVLVHRCEKCGFERLNRVAGDDEVELLTKLAGEPIK